MNPILYILGFVIMASLPYPSVSIETSPSHALVLQDSTPPNKGRVKVGELTLPSKKGNKKTSKSNQPRKNRSEKIADVTQTKAYKDAQRKKEREAKKNGKKEPKVVEADDSKKNKSSNGLSQEEELKILAKTDDINATDKAHPSTQYNCKFAFDVVDEFTGVQKKGLMARPFFNYTPDEYRKFIKEEDFIRCEGFLSQSSGGNMALNLNLYIASRDAKHKFGRIKSNSALVLSPMKGKEFFLMTYQGAEPQVSDNMTYYQCSFAINKSDLKNLKKAEIDQVKISFQKGFQTYDVFYLDFMIDQFPCFE